MFVTPVPRELAAPSQRNSGSATELDANLAYSVVFRMMSPPPPSSPPRLPTGVKRPNESKMNFSVLGKTVSLYLPTPHGVRPKTYWVSAAAANAGLWWRLKIDSRPFKHHHWSSLAADADAWCGYTLKPTNLTQSVLLLASQRSFLWKNNKSLDNFVCCETKSEKPLK